MIISKLLSFMRWFVCNRRQAASASCGPTILGSIRASWPSLRLLQEKKNTQKHREISGVTLPSLTKFTLRKHAQWFSDQEMSEADSPRPSSCLTGGTPPRRRIKSLLTPPFIVSLQVQYSSWCSILTVHLTHCHSIVFQCKHHGFDLKRRKLPSFPPRLWWPHGPLEDLGMLDHDAAETTCDLPWAQTVRTPWQIEID